MPLRINARVSSLARAFLAFYEMLLKAGSSGQLYQFWPSKRFAWRLGKQILDRLITNPTFYQDLIFNPVADFNLQYVFAIRRRVSSLQIQWNCKNGPMISSPNGILP